MAAWRYEISLLVLKKYLTSERSGHVISSINYILSLLPMQRLLISIATTTFLLWVIYETVT